MMISRQMIAAAVSAVAGVLLLFLPIEIDQAFIVENIANVLGGITILYGIALGILRKITSTPLLGWFTKAKK